MSDWWHHNGWVIAIPLVALGITTLIALIVAALVVAVT